MYRVKVMDYNHNITPGSRYCFTQKTALRLVKLFLSCGAKAEEDFTVEKFIVLVLEFLLGVVLKKIT